MGGNLVVKKDWLIFSQKLGEHDTYKFSKTDKYTSIYVFQKPQIAKGIASYCSDGKHVLFIDYDNVPKWLVKQDYERIQKKYILPPAYLFATKEEEWDCTIGNYHVICLAKFYPAQIYGILEETHADINFKSMLLRRVYRNWVLRISDKKGRGRPKFLEVIGEIYPSGALNREVSNAHLKLFKKIYPDLPDLRHNNLDKGGKVFLQEYETTS